MTEDIRETQARIEAIGEQLRAKINSKFQTSTFLAGFAFTILGIQISVLWQSTKVPQSLPVSISLMLGAIFLYIGAIVKLDELTMPKRFWEEDKNKKQPGVSHLAYLDQEDLWELQRRMIFYWTTLTIVATFLTAISLFLMLLPFAPKDLFTSSNNFTELLWITFNWAVIFIFLVFVYFVVLINWARKNFKPLLRPHD